LFVVGWDGSARVRAARFVEGARLQPGRQGL